MKVIMLIEGMAGCVPQETDSEMEMSKRFAMTYFWNCHLWKRGKKAGSWAVTQSNEGYSKSHGELSW